MNNRFMASISKVKMKDLIAPAVFLFMLAPSMMFRLINKNRNRKLILVAEDGEARDNGYHFYKYIRENHPEDFCFYAMSKKSNDFRKVGELGNIIEYGSLRHWLYYMSANLNVSSQKAGNPNPIFWYIIHVLFRLYRNRVFLQHGITHNDAKWLYCDKTKFKYFICGAKDEYNFVKKNFGYPKNAVILAGFARWDNLEDNSNGQKSILIMPTWRNWLGGDRNIVFETKDFESTAFFKNWNNLLTNKEFINYIEREGIIVYFYPHINMQKFLKSFVIKSKNIIPISISGDIQQYFSKCNLMITDYSSVAFDFAYMGKPIVYFQFDSEEFRRRQYAKGYFDYVKNGFGDVLLGSEAIIEKIQYYYENKFKPESKYIKRTEDFFTLKDGNNSERIYNAIVEAGK